MPSPTASPAPPPILPGMSALRAAMLALLLAFAAGAGAEALYATSIRTRLGPDAPIECNLYTVDPANARASFVAPLKAPGGTPIAIVSLATQPGTGVIFGVTAPPAGPATLVTVDPQTGRVTLIGRIGHDVSDIAFDRRGRLFAWLPDGNRLARIDPATGSAE